MSDQIGKKSQPELLKRAIELQKLAQIEVENNNPQLAKKYLMEVKDIFTKIEELNNSSDNKDAA